MVAAGAKVYPQNVSHIPVDPQYQSAVFRKAQAERYLDFFMGKTELTQAEHNLIPRLCFWEIKQVQAWRAITRVEKLIFMISDPIFSRMPNDTKTTTRIVGGSAVVIGALMASAHTRNDKIIGLALIAFLALLYKEMNSRK